MQKSLRLAFSKPILLNFYIEQILSYRGTNKKENILYLRSFDGEQSEFFYIWCKLNGMDPKMGTIDIHKNK